MRVVSRVTAEMPDFRVEMGTINRPRKDRKDELVLAEIVHELHQQKGALLKIMNEYFSQVSM